MRAVLRGRMDLNDILGLRLPPSAMSSRHQKYGRHVHSSPTRVTFSSRQAFFVLGTASCPNKRRCLQPSQPRGGARIIGRSPGLTHPAPQPRAWPVVPRATPCRTRCASLCRDSAAHSELSCGGSPGARSASPLAMPLPIASQPPAQARPRARRAGPGRMTLSVRIAPPFLSSGASGRLRS